MRFKVIDLLTEKEPDIRNIALTEEWAKSLLYCAMEGFHIEEDGTLCLADECGSYVYCPHERFKVEVEIMALKQSYVYVY